MESESERVPNESYVPDGMWEEERIMAERSAEPRALDSRALREPLLKLGLAPAVTVPAETSLIDAVDAMRCGRVGCVLVVSADGKLSGIFTERDVLRLAGREVDWIGMTVSQMMTARPETLPSSANMAFALNVMLLGGFRRVPIVDEDGKPCAVVSMKDVVRFLMSFFEEEVQNLPPRATLVNPTKREDG